MARAELTAALVGGEMRAKALKGIVATGLMTVGGLSAVNADDTLTAGFLGGTFSVLAILAVIFIPDEDYERPKFRSGARKVERPFMGIW